MKTVILHLRPRTLLLAVAALAALTFNNWILGFIVNSHTIFSAKAVSDLSAQGQPGAYLFQALDITSGALFIMSALLAAWQKVLRMESFIFIATIALGAANILDASFPVRCLSHCSSNLGTVLFHLHTYTSIVIVLTLISLPLSGWRYAQKHRNSNIQNISLATAIFSIFSIAFVLTLFAFSHSFSAQGYGPVQELHLLIFGYWFALFYSSLASNLQHR